MEGISSYVLSLVSEMTGFLWAILSLLAVAILAVLPEEPLLALRHGVQKVHYGCMHSCDLSRSEIQHTCHWPSIKDARAFAETCGHPRRTMSTSVYTLNDGTKGVEVNRLDWQHRDVFRPVTEDLVPQEVHQYITSLGRPPAVADVATGTGVWLRDMATVLPFEAQLDGFDFDTSKFPEPGQLPPNVKLAWGDALKPAPEESHDQYDLVHIRCLMYGLKANQWEQIAANMCLLLRPGGYLIWDEVGYPSWNCLPMTETFQKVINLDVRYAATVGRDVTSPVNLPNHMKAAGFHECHQLTFSTFSKGKEVQKLGAEVVIAGVSQSLKGIVSRGGYDWAQTDDDVDR